MRTLSFCGLLLAGLSAASSLAAAAPRTPTGRWVVSFDPQQCVASRNYGTADKPVMLVFKAPAEGKVLQLGVLRPGAAGGYANQVEGRLRFAGGVEQKISALTYSPPKQKTRVSLFNLQRSEVGAWPNKGILEVKADRGLSEAFDVSGLTNVLKVMDECVTDLRGYWNYTEDGEAPKVRERAKGSIVRLFSANDYPAAAVTGGLSGTVAVTLLIDEAGKVADCTLVQTSGVASLDAQTCVIIESRARYKPAIGFDGKPARDFDNARIRWVMPR